MTNEKIIENAAFELLREGKIKGSGNVVSVTFADGTEAQVEYPEAIHTFAYWKACGFCVKKGEKAVVKLSIWKHVSKKREVPEDADETTKALLSVPDSKMFMKTAAFFAAHQVEPIQA